MDNKVSFVQFFLMWAKFKRWEVPPIHLIACEWFENCEDDSVFMAFRGFSKSTILAVYNAWRYYLNPTYRILHQGENDKMANKTSRDTKNVIMRHPLTKHLGGGLKGEVSFWWVPGYEDERNPSMQAAGILTTITSSRADEIQNDDIEVPRNIGSEENREKMRGRISEQTHIAVPGTRTRWIGTPHTHNSIYTEQIRLGADYLIIPMFQKEQRIDEVIAGRPYKVNFYPEYVFSGVGEYTKVLREDKDYQLDGDMIVFSHGIAGFVDLYAKSAWPERFDNKELVKRRKKCRTINEWDSQYQLHAKPISNTRLDPDKLIPYDIEPEIRFANGEIAMWLGKVRIVGAVLYWDPATGKVKADESVVTVLFTDERGNLYWHRSIALTGPVFTDDENEKAATQCYQTKEVMMYYQISAIDLEVNGLGTFLPHLMRRALAGTGAGVREIERRTNKDQYILDAIETPLNSGFLWAHSSIWETRAVEQMREYIPKIDSKNDRIDSLAGAITGTPIRIGKIIGKIDESPFSDWRPDTGVFEIEFNTD